MVNPCLLSIFGSGTESAHLGGSENHYPGPLVKSADRIVYRSRETQPTRMQTEREGGGGGIADEISCERRGN